MLSPGETILAVAGLQLPVDRGGFADASHTMTIELDPALGADTIATLDKTLLPAGAPAIPEPVTLSLFGAGVLGFGALRRRKRKSV